MVFSASMGRDGEGQAAGLFDSLRKHVFDHFNVHLRSHPARRATLGCVLELDCDHHALSPRPHTNFLAHSLGCQLLQLMPIDEHTITALVNFLGVEPNISLLMCERGSKRAATTKDRG